MVRGMTERRQHRWFLTKKGRGRCSTSPTTSIPPPGRKQEPKGLAAFHPDEELPEDYPERFALDHDHPVHLEGQGCASDFGGRQ